MNSLTNKRKEADKSKFNIREYAINNLTNRHIFKQEEESINVGLGEQIFESHFLHSDEIVNYFNNKKDDNGNNTLAGYGGSVYSNYLKIDIDEKDKSLQQVRELLKYWESSYDLNLNYIQVNFSGSKGFHIRIPADLFGGFAPSDNLPNIHKKIAQELTDSFVKIDETIYRTTGLFRAVNSVNSKSGLFAIPLEVTEIFSLTYDEIKELAKEQREGCFGYEGLAPVEGFIELKEAAIKEFTKEDKKPKPINWSSEKEGKRFESLRSAVGRLIRTNLSNKDILQLGLTLNNQHNPPKDEETATKLIRSLLSTYGNIEGDFWIIKREIEKGKPLKITVDIDQLKFINYLNKEGFGKIFLDKSPIFIKEKEKIITECSAVQIKDYVLNKVADIDNSVNPYKTNLQNKLLQGVGKYFNEKLLECVATKTLSIQRDDKLTARIYYRNGFVTLEKDKTPTLTPLDKLEFPIWETSIIKRDIQLLHNKTAPSEFEQFLKNAMRGSEERFINLCSAIGYLLHGHKHQSNAKAVILCDEKISDLPNGRSGKSLVGKAIRNIVPVSNIDGKNFKFAERFTFQNVDLDTKVVDFNDVRKDFDFERLFSVLTDDMSLEYKNTHPFKLPFKESPKVMVSTNYTIKGNGGSYKDRMIEIEFSDHYNENHKPIDEFDHLFFEDWDDEEWNRFDNFMLECLQLYLDEGLIGCAPLNLEVRKLRDQTSPEFVEFAEQNVITGIEYDLKELYNNFKKSIGYDFEFTNPCPIKQNTFTEWLKVYSEFRKLSFNKRSSNSRQLVLLVKK